MTQRAKRRQPRLKRKEGSEPLILYKFIIKNFGELPHSSWFDEFADREEVMDYCQQILTDNPKIEDIGFEVSQDERRDDLPKSDKDDEEEEINP